MRDIELEEAIAIVSCHAFEELKRFDKARRDGWLAVLSRTLPVGAAGRPRTAEG